MPILTFILIVALIGFGMWLITTYIPMPDPIKKVLVIGVTVFIVVWVLQLLGVFNMGPVIGPVYHR